MSNNSLIAKIKSLRAGTIHTVTYTKDIKPAKEYKGNVITKTTKLSFRTGCRYSNLSAVKRRREQTVAAPVSNKPLWWGWVDGCERRIKYKLSDPTQLYFNVCPTPEVKIKSSYMLNGKPATKQEIIAITPPSMWTAHDCDTLDIAFENIISIK